MAIWNNILGVLTGYSAGETDFGIRLQRSPPATHDELTRLVQRLATVVADPAAVAVLRLTGHSDRQDRADMTAEQRRASELEASEKRVASASQWIVARLSDVIGPPPDGSNWPKLLIVRAAVGASALIYPTPTDAQRMENRRLEVEVYAMNAAAFPNAGEVLELV